MSVLSVGFVFRTITPMMNPIAAPTKVKRTSKFAFTISKHFSLPFGILKLLEKSRYEHVLLIHQMLDTFSKSYIYTLEVLHLWNEERCNFFFILRLCVEFHTFTYQGYAS